MCEQQPAKFSFLKDLRLLQADKSEADFNHSSGKALINKESLEDNEEIPRVRMNASDAMCDVCGAKAGKHTYYGGKVCPGKRVLIKTGVTLLWVIGSAGSGLIELNSTVNIVTWHVDFFLPAQ